MLSKPDKPWYDIQNVSEIDTPALVVYPERVLKNIRTAKGMVPDVSFLRPHVKTHKSLELTRLLLAEGITKFKCATIAEAEMLATARAPDVLLAYQPVGPKVLRLRSLVSKYRDTSFGCVVDDVRAAQNLAGAFAGLPASLPVCLDLNVGMNRTGVSPGENALELYQACSKMSGIKVVGLHAYDGHIQDSDPQVRSERCDAAFIPVSRLGDTLRSLGFPVPIVVAGGSPTFPIHARRHGIECSPGTFVYWDKSYLESLPDQDFLPAALVLTRVISRPTADTACLDLGHKSIAAEKDLQHRVHFLNAPNAEALSQSEEHLLIRGPEIAGRQIGDVLYGMPYHICPTCALYERALTIVGNQALGEWRIVARDRSISL
jgi:D-threonine aldolase